jgi:hypothetical protein
MEPQAKCLISSGHATHGTTVSGPDRWENEGAAHFSQSVRLARTSLSALLLLLLFASAPGSNNIEHTASDSSNSVPSRLDLPRPAEHMARLPGQNGQNSVTVPQTTPRWPSRSYQGQRVRARERRAIRRAAHQPAPNASIRLQCPGE